MIDKVDASDLLPEISTIVYATSLGHNTRPVFRMALKLALLNNARIIMTYAAEPMSEFGHALVESYLPGNMAEKLAEEGKRNLLQKMTDRVKRFYEEELADYPEHLRVKLDYVVKEATPADLIMETAGANNADLIVIGSHSQNSVSRMLMGSTARKISDLAKRPVLVVPNKST